MRTLLLAALALLAAPVFAQDVTLRPGHPDLMTDGLTFESHTLAVRIAEPNVQDLGLITHQVTRDGSTIMMNVDANVPQARNVGETSLSFDAATLAPISRQRSTSGSTGSTAYDGAHVTGAYGRGDWAPLAFDITLPGAAFAPEQVEIIARALPFRDGYSAAVPTFSADRRVRNVAVTVIGEEEFTRLDGSVAMTWVVEAVTDGRGGGTQRYFVDATTRDLVATTFSPQEGTTVVTEPTTEEALAAMAAAQSEAVAMAPGGEGFDASVLATGSHSYDINVVQPIQQKAGTFTRTLTVDPEAGTVTLEIQQEITMAGQKVSQTTVAAYPSLAPISSSSTVNDSSTEVVYGDGTATRTDGEESTEITFDEAVFAPSFLFEIARLIPYEEGYRTTFYTLSPSEGALPVTLSVGAPTEIDGTTAWPVVSDGGPGQTFTFYVDPETREFVRMEQSPQVGVVIHIVPAAMAE